MLKLPARVRVFVSTEPCDMRRQFDGLATLVREKLGQEPRSGHLFLFLNRRATLVKILFSDAQGICMLSKRLDRGTFPRLRGATDSVPGCAEVSTQELAALLSGAALAGQVPH
jgi:transposase